MYYMINSFTNMENSIQSENIETMVATSDHDEIIYNDLDKAPEVFIHVALLFQYTLLHPMNDLSCYTG